MRQKIVAGNWKMNPLAPAQVHELLSGIAAGLRKEPVKAERLIVSPPFPFLASVLDQTKDSSVGVAAQNCHHKESGAYTGESSAAMIKAMGAEYVIIGHSERRTYFAESNAELGEKVKMALLHDLRPIFCCGESLEERKGGKVEEVLRQQLQEALFDLPENQIAQLIIAYEPVWAIGTGETASPEQAQEAHKFIRELFRESFGALADNISILYGGSVKPANAVSIFAQPDVDGGLIGGASLKAADFLAIANAF